MIISSFEAFFQKVSIWPKTPSEAHQVDCLWSTVNHGPLLALNNRVVGGDYVSILTYHLQPMVETDK